MKLSDKVKVLFAFAYVYVFIALTICAFTGSAEASWALLAMFVLPIIVVLEALDHGTNYVIIVKAE